MIADIAAVFHWPLAELVEMEIDDLLMWQKHAADRIPRME